MAVTLANLRDQAKQASDNVNSLFLTDAEWNNLIQQSYFELYGLVVQAYGNDYFVQTPYSFVTDGINNLFALPADFFKLLGVDLAVSGSTLWVSLKSFAFNDRNRFGLVSSPAPAAGQTVRLWYVPTPPAMDSDNDLLPTNLLMWSEFITADSIINALAKEEADVSTFMAIRQQTEERIKAEAENRDAGSPAHIVDYYATQSTGMRYRLNGTKLWLAGGSTPVLPYGDGALGGWDW